MHNISVVTFAVRLLCAHIVNPVSLLFVVGGGYIIHANVKQAHAITSLRIYLYSAIHNTHVQKSMRGMIAIPQRGNTSFL